MFISNTRRELETAKIGIARSWGENNKKYYLTMVGLTVYSSFILCHNFIMKFQQLRRASLVASGSGALVGSARTVPAYCVVLLVCDVGHQ